MPNGTYGGVRGRKTKVGRKLLRFPPTRLYPRRESNPNQKFRKLLFYPLNYKGKLIAKILLFRNIPIILFKKLESFLYK